MSLFGSTRIVESTPTISTSPYSVGDLIGSKIIILGAVIGLTRSSGIIHSILIADKAGLGADIDIVFFDSNPTATTFTDNAALNVADADLSKIVGVAQITTDSAFSTNGVSFATGLNILLSLSSSDLNLYVALVARAAATYSSTSDLTVRIGVMQD